MSLAEVQKAVRDILVGTDAPRPVLGVVGGEEPSRRLALHRRHYGTSLTSALMEKFPGTAWLVGERELFLAAAEFIRLRPPTTPIIAEYGGDFPEFLGARLSPRAPYVRDFAELELLVGRVSVAIAEPPVGPSDLRELTDDELSGALMDLQPGVRYLRVDWPIDRLLELFLTGSAPDRLVLFPEVLHLEIRGARGEFTVSRMTRPRFAFRTQLSDGASFAESLDAAREDSRADAGLDADAVAADELAALLAEGLVVRMMPSRTPDPASPPTWMSR